jgi:hypothetical protein
MKTKVKLMTSSALILTTLGLFNNIWSMEDNNTFNRDYAQITGRVVQWLNKPPSDLYVQVTLNNEDPLAKESNIGKFQPVMLSEVKRNDNSDDSFSNYVVILEQGSHINFSIMGKGRFGFGYNISINNEKIAKNVYRVDSEGKNDYLISSLRRYDNTPKTIMVDSFNTMRTACKNEKEGYIFCNIKAFEVDEFKRNIPQTSYLYESISDLSRGISEAANTMHNSLASRSYTYQSFANSFSSSYQFLTNSYYSYRDNLDRTPADEKGNGVHEGVKSESNFGSITTKDGKDIGDLKLQFIILPNQEEKEFFVRNCK